MFSRKLYAISVAAAAFVSQVAQAQACPMPYDKFEMAVPHLDLDTCPASVSQKDVFCRANVANDEVHVFVFERGGERCLVSVTSFDEAKYQLTLK